MNALEQTTPAARPAPRACPSRAGSSARRSWRSACWPPAASRSSAPRAPPRAASSAPSTTTPGNGTRRAPRRWHPQPGELPGHVIRARPVDPVANRDGGPTRVAVPVLSRTRGGSSRGGRAWAGGRARRDPRPRRTGDAPAGARSRRRSPGPPAPRHRGGAGGPWSRPARSGPTRPCRRRRSRTARPARADRSGARHTGPRAPSGRSRRRPRRGPGLLEQPLQARRAARRRPVALDLEPVGGRDAVGVQHLAPAERAARAPPTSPGAR